MHAWFLFLRCFYCSGNCWVPGVARLWLSTVHCSTSTQCCRSGWTRPCRCCCCCCCCCCPCDDYESFDVDTTVAGAWCRWRQAQESARRQRRWRSCNSCSVSHVTMHTRFPPLSCWQVCSVGLVTRHSASAPSCLFSFSASEIFLVNYCPSSVNFCFLLLQRAVELRVQLSLGH